MKYINLNTNIKNNNDDTYEKNINKKCVTNYNINDNNMNDRNTDECNSQLIKLNFVNNKNNYVATFDYTDNKFYYFFPNILCIEIEKNKFNMPFDEIIDLISDQNIQILIDGQTIFYVPISFFINFYGIVKENNKIFISLNFKMFYQNVIFYHTDFIRILINENLSKNGLDLLFSMDIEIKKTICELPTKMLFQFIQTHVIDNINNLFIHEKLNQNHLAKGFFISGDIDSICELKLRLNGNDRFIYDEILLNTICTRINNKILYVPFDINEKYDDCNELSYYNSLNLSRIDTAIFHIKLNYMTDKFLIYTLTGNYLLSDVQNRFYYLK